MTDMRLAVMGAAGRMGRSLLGAILETDGVTIGGGTEAPGSDRIGQDLGTLAGVGELGITVIDDPLPLFTQVEGVLDFTAPAASTQFAGFAAQARIVHVIGTTGFSEPDLEKLEAAARHATIIKAGNMSLGVNLLLALVERASQSLEEEFDIEIVEMHHRHKVDAPSGTALMLGEAAAKGRAINLKNHSVRQRDGHTGPRSAGDIGFATLRGGGVIGEHKVIFASDSERIELTHRAEDRSVFARGAVQAALWGRDRGPGLYSMTDVLGL